MRKTGTPISMRFPVELEELANYYHINKRRTAQEAIEVKVIERLAEDGVEGKENAIKRLIAYHEIEVQHHQKIVLTLQGALVGIKPCSTGTTKTRSTGTTEKRSTGTTEEAPVFFTTDRTPRIRKTQYDFLDEISPVYFPDEEIHEYYRALTNNGNEVGTACEFYEDLKQRVRTEKKREGDDQLIDAIDAAGDDIPDLVLGYLRASALRQGWA